MGKVWLDGAEIGTFTPQTEGTYGDVYINATDVGDFSALLPSGYVYANATVIGTYISIPTGPPPEDFGDARKRTKLYLDAYLAASKISKDDDSAASFAVIYAYPPYPLEQEFKAASNPVDVLFLVGCPTAGPLIADTRVEESVPIEIWCIDKTGITGTKLKWKCEKELRRVLKSYHWGSFRSLDRVEDNDQRLGSTTFYSTRLVFNYRRTATY